MAGIGLFSEEELYGENNSPVENVDITTTILYMSKEELKEFKVLAKKGIKQMFGQEFQQKGNLTDFLLTLMREKYGEDNLSANGKPAAASVKAEETHDTEPSGIAEGEVPFGW